MARHVYIYIPYLMSVRIRTIALISTDRTTACVRRILSRFLSTGSQLRTCYNVHRLASKVALQCNAISLSIGIVFRCRVFETIFA